MSPRIIEKKSKELREALTENGDGIKAGTALCNQWMTTNNNNCSGCKSEVGCLKYSVLLTKIVDVEKRRVTHQKFSRLVLLVLKAKTPNEINHIEKSFKTIN